MAAGSDGGTPSGDEVIKRDKILRDLRGLAASGDIELAQAADRLRSSVKKHIGPKNVEIRAKTDRTVKSLPVARGLALGRITGKGSLERPSRMKFDPRHPPAGFSVVGLNLSGPPAKWMEAAYKAVGQFDRGLAEEVVLNARWLESAHTGCYGKYTAVSCIDLRKSDALAAFVHSQCVQLLNPDGEVESRRATEEEVRASLDAVRVTSFTGTPWWALKKLVHQRVLASMDDVISSQVAWDVVLLVLLVVDPDFGAATVGLDEMPTWENDGSECWTQRKEILSDFNTADSPDARSRLWIWAERARDHLKSAPGAVEPHSVVTLMPPPQETRQLSPEEASRAAERAGEENSLFHNTYYATRRVWTSLQSVERQCRQLAAETAMEPGSVRISLPTNATDATDRQRPDHVLCGEEFATFKSNAVTKAISDLAAMSVELVGHMSAVEPGLGRAELVADGFRKIDDPPLVLGAQAGRTVIRLVHDTTFGVLFNLCSGIDHPTWHLSPGALPPPDLTAYLRTGLARRCANTFDPYWLDPLKLSDAVFSEWRVRLEREGARVTEHALQAMETARAAAIAARKAIASAPQEGLRPATQLSERPTQDALATTPTSATSTSKKVGKKRGHHNNRGIADKKQASSDVREPLGHSAAAVYEELLKLPVHRGLTGPDLLDALSKRDPPVLIDQSTLTSRLVPELRPYGIENKPRVGYYIRSDARPN